MNNRKPDNFQKARPRASGGKAEPSASVTGPGAAPVSLASLPAEAERFIANICALEALAAKYLQTMPDGRGDVLRRAVTPGDQAALRQLLAESDGFMAAHPAGHAVWRPLQQRLSRQCGLTTVREVSAMIERSKPLLVEYRMERIATVAKKLSHVIEMFPQRPFAEALKQLTAAEQEVFHQAVSHREWSDLFLTPLGQKVLLASRPAGAAPTRSQSVAAARRKKSASYVARQNHTAESSQPKRPPRAK
jgi:hypothetical protein